MPRKHKCPKCGTKCKNTMKYCPECGYSQFQEKSDAETRKKELSALNEFHDKDKFEMHDDSITHIDDRDIDMAKAQKAFDEMQDHGGFFAED